jgi:hypothetical protein
MSTYSKRTRTLLTIGAAALGTGGVSAAPTIGAEVPKQGVIAIGDLVMCTKIYEIWFDERVTTEQLRDILIDAGLASAAGGILVYGGVKLTEGLLAEALNLLGPIGWGISGTITGSVTCLVGLTFWAFCENPPPWLLPDPA